MSFTNLIREVHHQFVIKRMQFLIILYNLKNGEWIIKITKKTFSKFIKYNCNICYSIIHNIAHQYMICCCIYMSAKKCIILNDKSIDVANMSSWTIASFWSTNIFIWRFEETTKMFWILIYANQFFKQMISRWRRL